MSAIDRASRLKLMAFDVDGVMTDGRLYFSGNGEELKAFHTLDGKGLKMLQEAGLTLAIITGRKSGLVECRAKELGIPALFQDIKDKRECLARLMEVEKISWKEAGFMGDDLPDLAPMLSCGFAAAPANAHPFVKKHAHFISISKGGEGAVREICDFILEAHGKLDEAQNAALCPLPHSRF